MSRTRRARDAERLCRRAQGIAGSLRLGAHADDVHLAIVEQAFRHMGDAARVPKKAMGRCHSRAGSGPAQLCSFSAEAMIEAANPARVHARDSRRSWCADDVRAP